MSEYTYAVGDWGGTNFRGAISTADNIGEVHHYECKDFQGPVTLLRTFLDDAKVDVSDLSGLVLAVAGPADDPENFKFSNNNHFNAANFSAVGKTLGVPVILCNDFSAQAYAAADLKWYELKQIAGPENVKIPGELWDKTAPHNSMPVIQVPPKNRFIIAGPGTGLGMCTLNVSGAHITVMEGEGGHANFAPQNDEEYEIISSIRQNTNSPVSYEMLASGPGLVNIYKAVTDDWESTIKPQEITAFQDSEEDKIKAVSICISAFARAVGTAMLVTQAKGGVIIPAGSIVSSLGDRFDVALFRQSLETNDFQSKAPDKNPAANLPVYIMQKKETGLWGAHVYAQTLTAG